MNSADVARIERDFKIPCADSLWPSRYAIVTLALQHFGTEVLVPDDDELRVIASYVDYKLTTFYREGYAAEVRAQPLPFVPGHNTVVVAKFADGDRTHRPERWQPGWGYRRHTWQTGTWPQAYFHRPVANLPDHPLSILELFDAVEGTGGSYPYGPYASWAAWKLEHELTKGVSA